jgi:hypothetical protein
LEKIKNAKRIADLPLMQSMEELKTDTYARWQASFDRIPEIGAAKLSGVRQVYGEIGYFKLEDYVPGKFKAGPKLHLERRSPSDCEYWLDPQGQPCYYTDSFYSGAFLYNDTEAEHLCISGTSGIISCYQRVELQGQLQRTWQHLGIQAVNNHPASELRNRIHELAHSLFLMVESKEITDNRITGGKGFMFGSGLAGDTYDLDYRYASDGKLERIARVFPSGPQTIWAARSSRSTNNLAAETSLRIAGEVLRALDQTQFDSPLRVLQLSYSTFDNWCPLLIPCTERDLENTIRNLDLAMDIPGSSWIRLPADALEPDLTEFLDRVPAPSTAPVKMLRQAAALVTTQVRQRPYAGPRFAAFAFDGEMEAESGSLARVMKECGADPTDLKIWKKQGLLD